MKTILKILIVLSVAAVHATGWAADIYNAAIIGNVAALRELLANDPELVNKVHPVLGTPLFLAASFGKKEAVQFLLANKADSTAKDSTGFTPLEGICSNPSQIEPTATKAIIEALLSHGANVNVRNKWGSTPLHAAIKRKNLAAVEALLDHKADVNSRDNRGSRPLDFLPTRDHQYSKIGQLLLKHGAKRGVGAIHNAILGSDSAEVKRLLSEQPEVANERQPGLKEGNFPIHIAVMVRENELLRLLLLNKADVTRKDDIGCTALHWAAKRNNIEAARLLLANKAEVNAKDVLNRTPIDYATKWKGIVELLQSHGGKSGKEFNTSTPDQKK